MRSPLTEIEERPQAIGMAIVVTEDALSGQQGADASSASPNWCNEKTIEGISDLRDEIRPSKASGW